MRRYSGAELLCRRTSWKLVSGARFDIIQTVESGPGRLLIQCSSEDRQVVEGSYGEKLAEHRWTESYDFHCLGLFLRGHLSDSGRIDRRSGG